LRRMVLLMPPDCGVLSLARPRIFICFKFSIIFLGMEELVNG
jgi:hypothetical protein